MPLRAGTRVGKRRSSEALSWTRSSWLLFVSLTWLPGQRLISQAWVISDSAETFQDQGSHPQGLGKTVGRGPRPESKESPSLKSLKVTPSPPRAVFL